MGRFPSYVEGALSLSRIEARPKKLVIVGGDEKPGEKPRLRIHPDTKAIWSRALQDDLLGLLRRIEAGTPVPARYYRRSTRYDRLLFEHHRMMHLHLDGPGSDVLLYLVQRAASVLLVEVADHRYLETDPPGAALRRDRIMRAAGRFPDPVRLTRRE